MRQLIGAAVTSTLVFLLFCANAQADSSEQGRITSIIVEGASLISVWLDGTDHTAECTGGSRWTLVNTDPLFKEKYAALLAAAAAGQSVSLLHLSTSGCGPFNGNTIHYVATNY